MGLFATGTAGKYWKASGQGIKPKNFGPYTALAWTNAATSTDTIYALAFAVDATAADNTGGHATLFQLSGGWRVQVNDGTNASYIGGNVGTTTAGQWFGLVVAVESFGSGALTLYSGKNADVSTNAGSGTFSVDTTWNDFSVHATPGNAVTTSANDLVAEIAVWNRVLGTGDVKRLLSGANPLSIRGNAPLHYWPLIGDLRNLGRSGLGLTPVGNPTTKWGSHPPVALPPVKGRRTPFAAAISVPSFRRPVVSICT